MLLCVFELPLSPAMTLPTSQRSWHRLEYEKWPQSSTRQKAQPKDQLIKQKISTTNGCEVSPSHCSIKHLFSV